MWYNGKKHKNHIILQGIVVLQNIVVLHNITTKAFTILCCVCCFYILGKTCQKTKEKKKEENMTETYRLIAGIIFIPLIITARNRL